MSDSILFATVEFDFPWYPSLLVLGFPPNKGGASLLRSGSYEVGESSKEDVRCAEWAQHTQPAGHIIVLLNWGVELSQDKQTLLKPLNFDGTETWSTVMRRTGA